MSTEAAIKIFVPRMEPRGGKSSIHWDDKLKERALRDNVTKWAKALCSKSQLADRPLVEKMLSKELRDERMPLVVIGQCQCSDNTAL